MAGALAEIQPDGVREVVDCPFCGSDEREPVTGAIPDILGTPVEPPFAAMRFQIVRCRACGLLYQRVRPGPADIGRFYGSDYFCYEPLDERGALVRALARRVARQLIRTVERHRASGADLFVDFGCGTGSWLDVLRIAGAPWQMMGTEIDPALVAQVEALGFPARVCTHADLEGVFDPGSIGVFYMNHVIEHLPSPLAFLETLRSRLVPGGLVVGQTPDAACLERRVFGDAWTQWHLPQHLVVFDRETLARHAERAGLEVVEIRPSPSGASQWGASALHGWARRRGRVYRATREPLHPYLTLVFLPVAFLQCALGSTSHMDFVLRNPG